MTLQEATHIINNSKDYTQEKKDQAREVIVEACMKTHEKTEPDPAPYESWDDVLFLYH